MFHEVMEALDSFFEVCLLGAGLPTRRFWCWGRVSRVDLFRSAAAITIPAHMARLAAAEAGPLGHELRTFCFSEGVQSPSSLFFSHVTSFVGRIFRDVSTIVHLACVHIHGVDLVAPVAALASGGVLGAEYGVSGSLGRHLIVVEPKLLGPLLLCGGWSPVGFLMEPSILELLVHCLAFPGFLLPGCQRGGCGCDMCQDFPDERGLQALLELLQDTDV